MKLRLGTLRAGGESNHFALKDAVHGSQPSSLRRKSVFQES